MSLIKSSNPVLGDRFLKNARSYASSEVMTFKGTVNKTILLLLLVILGATYTWKLAFTAADVSSLYPWMIGGAIGGFISCLVIVFNPATARFMAPVYSVLEGLFLGGVSALYAAQTQGIVLQAVLVTLAVFFFMLFAYRTGIIKVTDKFRSGIIAATGGIMVAYLVTWIFSLFGVNFSFMYGNGLMSIGISLVIVVIAALNLVLDFDFINRGVQQGAPANMEWYGAFGIMVTLVWLYIEILRLLSKLSKR